ncbi:MAG: hypothetical protein K2I35_09750, partial [Duncaniella sp.]|nr:hypothetical protein [Duncaniella sp.]
PFFFFTISRQTNCLCSWWGGFLGILSEEYMAYEGSYIIRDGKKITDLSIVVPEILRQERMLNERIEAIEMSLEDADNIMLRSVESSVDMSNPEVCEAVKAALEY